VGRRGSGSPARRSGCGVDLNKPRMRNALAAVLALTAAPAGFTVAEFAAKVHAMTGQTQLDYSTRQAAYDLRKLRAKQLVDKPARTHRGRVAALAARTIAALLTLRDQVIAPILAGVRTPVSAANPPHGPTPTTPTNGSASRCTPSSTTSASPPQPPHRQPLVDPFRKRLA
jgi:hypothetical protein